MLVGQMSYVAQSGAEMRGNLGKLDRKRDDSAREAKGKERQ
jgi:hypothetical protein